MTSAVKKSLPARALLWARMKSFQVVILLALGCGWNAVTAKKVADRLV
jgi:hypothetical protein